MILEVALGLAVLYLLKQLADVVTELVGQDTADAQAVPVLWYVGLTGITSLAFLATRAMSNLAKEANALLVAEHIDQKIHSRAISADLAFYESPHYFDTLERAREAGNQRPAQVIGNLMLLIRSGLMLMGVMLLIISIHWLLLPLMMLAIIPALLARLYFTRHLYDWQRRRTQMERHASYLDWLMTSDLHAKELRLYQMGDYLKDYYAKLRGHIRRGLMKINKRRTYADIAAGSLATTAFFVVLLYLAWRTSQGQTSAGDLVLFMLIFQRAQSLGQEVIQRLSRLYEDHLYMGLLFRFLDMKPAMIDDHSPRQLPDKLTEGIRFESVSFRYPHAKAPALRDINLSIRPGQIVALVGANGSGKTSLIKLLCRLYDPCEGKITIEGMDIRDFDLERYRRQFSVVFQDYSHYAATVRENIHFGDIKHPIDIPSIKLAALKAGAHSFIEELPAQYDTPLTRMFDNGQEISIGQWQKVALARAFLRESKLIILDEPTSSIDPGAEFELFENFRERIDHRAALVISHRLSTVRMADYIYVMDKGQILEKGTHEDLVRLGGIYYELFLKQAYHYR
ncbi:ABC transporter ATP-binding protein [Halomonas maura]|uniref:ABC transporter ATP-binding protein n=1 Tax=Halomonas maura TaxID=117606 RepID=UPI0025B31370|nr:ABC transporter ATP-binding protein [Halomonas maura]MDN3554784.1 ABC transporter ATP-binding protein [Halomonas maura]